MAFENANWIWPAKGGHLVNETADFSLPFHVPAEGRCLLRIVAKSDYACFVGEKCLGNNAFADFPERKVYDELDLSSYAGKAIVISLLVLSKNYGTSSHIANGYGVIFEIVHEREVLLSSSPAILSRLDPRYVQGRLPLITGQLGMAYSYDFTKEETPYEASVVSDTKKGVFLARPIPKLVFSSPKDFIPLSEKLFYGGGERVGYLYFEAYAQKETDLLLSYGEHLVEGQIQYVIGERNFSLAFHLRKGTNTFFGPLFRLGLAYLEVEKGEGIHFLHLGLVDAVYPHAPFVYEKNPIAQDIAENSARTLTYCMHDHYEDCPWREQGQYTMDGRTEMLLGYLAFKETALPRSALLTMSYRRTSLGVFPITSPCATELSIPTFSLIYPLLVQDYWEHSGDLSLVKEVYPRMKGVVDHYLAHLERGVLAMLKEWNFFEWSEGLANDEEIFVQKEDPAKASLGNTCFLLIGLSSLAFLGEKLGEEVGEYRQQHQAILEAGHALFYDEGKHLFADYEKDGQKSSYSEYGQLFACYSGLAKEEKDALLETLCKPNSLTPLSLNNYLFKYELLLQQKGRYDAYVKKEVNRLWGKMVRQPPYTGWETLRGWKDFASAGSLCHGWSAVPLYVYHVFQERMAKSHENTSRMEAMNEP